MELLMLACPVIPLIVIFVWTAQSKARKARIEEAYKFDVPAIFGNRKIATTSDLKKAGLL